MREGAASLVLVSALLASCAHGARTVACEVPVHVALTAPALAACGGSIEALVYVGDQKAIDGPVHFPPGVTRVVVPPVWVPAGGACVQVVLADGSITADEEIVVRGETWVDVRTRGRIADIDVHRDPPPDLSH